MKSTKQDVEDLNSIPSEKLEQPPKEQSCKHQYAKKLPNGDIYCLECDTLYDWNGNEK